MQSTRRVLRPLDTKWFSFNHIPVISQRKVLTYMVCSKLKFYTIFGKHEMRGHDSCIVTNEWIRCNQCRIFNIQQARTAKAIQRKQAESTSCLPLYRIESINHVPVLQLTYVRRFNGRFKELNSAVNFLPDAIELKSNPMASILALRFPLTNASLTSLPASIFLTLITTWTPRNASTRAVSTPVSLDAPNTNDTHQIKLQNV